MDKKELRVLVHMLMIKYDAAISALFLCSSGQPSRALVAYHLERVGMPLGLTVKWAGLLGATTEIKAQVLSIWAKW